MGFVHRPVAARPASRPTRLLLGAGAAAGPAFAATFLAEGARTPGYDPLRHPISSLALGPRGRVQVANFAVLGAAYLGLAVGLARSQPRPSRVDSLTAVAVAAAGVGFLASGVFPTDPVNGYPPSSPDRTDAQAQTRAGVWHNAAAVPIFVGLPAIQALTAWSAARAGRRGWALASAGSAAGSVTGAALFGAAFSGEGPEGLVRVGGLIQRCAVAVDLGWTTAVAVRALLSPGHLARPVPGTARCRP
jgi:Protein of unknown function (DUF998)